MPSSERVISSASSASSLRNVCAFAASSASLRHAADDLAEFGRGWASASSRRDSAGKSSPFGIDQHRLAGRARERDHALDVRSPPLP